MVSLLIWNVFKKYNSKLNCQKANWGFEKNKIKLRIILNLYQFMLFLKLSTIFLLVCIYLYFLSVFTGKKMLTHSNLTVW